MSRLASWLRAWRCIRLEAQIARIDDDIDDLRAAHRYAMELVRELTDYRAMVERQLQALKQDNINHITRDNVRSMGK